MNNIEDMIYEINGIEIMLDSDLAKLYQVETKRINEAVKNNPNKFPERFSWQLSIEETKNISRSKISTLKIQQGFNIKYKARVFTEQGVISTLKIQQGFNIKYKARVFTEQGVYMLATILKSKVATEVSIKIMDTFVKMRHYINYNKNLLPNKILLLEEKVDSNAKRIDELFDKFNPKDIVKNYLFFEGELYDAYSLLLDIFNKSSDEIIIIDNYANKELLDILKNINKKIIIVSKNIDETLKKKYESQYNNITFIHNNSFHDRFIIIDRITLYSCGASFKDLGKKCFAINEIESNILLENLLNKI